jgi:PAS domain S-box-containing protein
MKTENIIILLFEDNPADVRLLKEMLKEISSFNSQLIISETMKDGCEQLTKNKIDIILLDLNLPDSIGKQTFDTINEFAEKIPVVLVSGLEDLELSVSLIELGAQDYITKHNLNSQLLEKTIQYALKRKQSEEKLRESEEKFRSIAEQTSDLIAITDANGIVIYASSSSKTLFQFDPEEMCGHNFMEFLIEPEIPKALAAFSHAIKDGTGTRDLELTMKRKDGSTFFGELNGSKFQQGLIKGTLVVIRDISERKQAEVALKESEEKFRSYIENAPDGIFVVDETGHYLEINKAASQITGYSEEEILSMGIIDISPQESLEIAGNNFAKVVSTGFSSSEFYYKHKNGTNRMWSVEAVKISDTRFLGFVKDITERKQNEKELIIAKDRAEESDRLKSAFLANMSHEIRTPMNGILGFSELLKEPKLTGEQQQEYIRIIEKSGARMLNIINDLVDISKIEANLMKVDINDVNINKKIEFIYIFFKPQVEEKGMQLLFKNTLPAKESIIRTDNEKVFSILTNLVKNAIKYSDGGKIEFGYVKRDETLEFYVKDTGIGIPKDRQSAIFERFIQADIADKMARQGAGLGLSISKAYVEMLGGKIWVESEEGIGSTFYFTLPYNALSEEKQVVQPQDKENQINPEISELKILIADDDEVSEMLITKNVEKFSKIVLKAGTGNEAVEVSRNNPDIDLILMDILMPVMNGYEATRQIRQFNKDVVIIAQTAFGLLGDREKAIEAGCNDYISKPINKEKLLSIIQKYFNK